MREKLLQALPELTWVSDDGLREKCIDAWMDGMRQGGWTVEDLSRLPFVIDELKDCPVLLIDHVRNVTYTAAVICDAMTERYGGCKKPDRDTVVAGALLHDIGKLLEYTKCGDGYGFSEYGKYVRHPAAGAIIAAENGLPQEIVHIIVTHSFEGERSMQTPESYIVKNADWLNFHYLAFTYPNQMKL